MQDWHAIAALRWVGLISLLVILVSGLIPVLRTARSLDQSISQLWGTAERHRRLIGISLTLGATCLSAFIVGWLTPTYHLGGGMYLVALVGYLAILGVAWIPMKERPGEHSWLHLHFVAGGAAASGAVVGYVIILLANVPPGSHNLTVGALLYSMLWPVFFLPRIRNYFIILEMVLAGLFMAVITALTLGW